MSSVDADAARPLVSVTLTNFNYARFLPRAIESILAQTFTDFELVIIDNASTDGSLELIGRYRDPRIRLVAHKSNIGGLSSFRESCEIARGTYRVHVDADDWIVDENAITRQVSMMESNPDMAFVYSSLTMFDEHGNKSWVSRPHDRDVVLSGEQALDDVLGFNFGHSGLMFRLDLYHQTGGYPDGMPHIDDLVLALRLAELGTVGYIDAELYAFHQHGANVHMSPGRSVVRDEILPMIAEAFDGPLGSRLGDASAVRRRIERRALVHLPTAYIFTDRKVDGWKLYWQSVRARPWLTVAQPRTASLVARTLLGSRRFDALRDSISAARRDRPNLITATGQSTETRRNRVAFITPSGWGNLGDAAIADSLIHAIRTRIAQPEVVGYTLHHLDTAARHGVEAHPITGFSLPYYPVLPEAVDDTYELPSFTGADAPAPPGSMGVADRMRIALRRRMWSVRAMEFGLGTVRARREPAIRRRLRAELAGTDAVVVAGGGQLDALFGGVWGQPYVLCRWSRLAKAVGARFLVLSVGTGTLDRLERVVVRRALGRADYRSYRDERSRDLIGCERLTNADPIVPDLAYALPISPQSMPTRERITVGVSPMNYQHPEFYPAAHKDLFEAHVTGMHRICDRLLAEGIDVVLFTTDASDDIGLAAVAGRLSRCAHTREGAWSIAGARTVEQLMELYGCLDAVVASRLHGVLLAHVAHRPVLALAHERKVRTLMSEVGHQRFCFDLRRLDVERLDRALDELIIQRYELSAEIAAGARTRRSRVEEQYDLVFGRKQSEQN